MLRPFQVETWALDVIDRVQKKEQIEYARVELKSEWIDPVKAARRLAAHANGARGDPILWLIGVNEQKGVIGASQKDLATWWPQVAGQFNQAVPSVVDVVVATSGGPSIVALHFDTSRYPFVVKNPAYGKAGAADAVSLEVPWREGTSTRSATRAEIMLMLSGLVRVPDVKVVSAKIVVVRYLPEQRAPHRLEWQLQADLFITPHGETVIPLHTGAVVLTAPGLSGQATMRDGSLKLRPPNSGTGAAPDSVTIHGTVGELVVRGPGLAHLEATFHSNDMSESQVEELVLHVDAEFTPAGASNPVRIPFKLRSLPRGARKSGVAAFDLSPT